MAAVEKELVRTQALQAIAAVDTVKTQIDEVVARAGELGLSRRQRKDLKRRLENDSGSADLIRLKEELAPQLDDIDTMDEAALLALDGEVAKLNEGCEQAIRAITDLNKAVEEEGAAYFTQVQASITTFRQAIATAQGALTTARNEIAEQEDLAQVIGTINRHLDLLGQQHNAILAADLNIPEILPRALLADQEVAATEAGTVIEEIRQAQALAERQIAAAREVIRLQEAVAVAEAAVTAAGNAIRDAGNPAALGVAAQAHLDAPALQGPGPADIEAIDLELGLNAGLVDQPNQAAAAVRQQIVQIRDELQQAQAAAAAVAALNTDGHGVQRDFVAYVGQLVRASINVEDAGISDREKLVRIRTHLELLRAERERIHAQQLILEQSTAAIWEATKAAVNAAIHDLDTRLEALIAAQAEASNNLVTALERANVAAQTFGATFESDLNNARRDPNASNAVEAIDQRRLELREAIEIARRAADRAHLIEPYATRLRTANTVAQDELMYLDAMDGAINRCAITLTEKLAVANVNARIAVAKAAGTIDEVNRALQGQKIILRDAEARIGVDLDTGLSPQLTARRIHLANAHANDEANATKRDIEAAQQEIDRIKAAVKRVEALHQAVEEARRVVGNVRSIEGDIYRAKEAAGDIATWENILREVDAQEQRRERALGSLTENLQYVPELSNGLIDAANRAANEVVTPLRQSQLFHAAIAAEAATAIAKMEVGREGDIKNLKDLMEKKLQELRQRKVALTEAITEVGDISALGGLIGIVRTAETNIDKEIEDLGKALALDAVCRAAVDKKDGIAAEVDKMLKDDGQSSRLKIEFIVKQQEILKGEEEKLKRALMTVNDVEGIKLLKEVANSLISDEITRLDALKKTEQEKAEKVLGKKLDEVHQKVIQNSLEIRGLLAEINEAKRVVVWAIDTDQPESVIDAERQKVEKLKKILSAKEADATEIGHEAKTLSEEIKDAESWLECTYPVPLAYLSTVNTELEARIAFEKNCADIAYHKGRTDRITTAIREDGEGIRELRELSESTELSPEAKHELAELSRHIQSGFDRLAESEAELIRLEGERPAAYEAVYAILDGEFRTRQAADFDVAEVISQIYSLGTYHEVDINEIQSENAELRDEYAPLLIYGNAQSAAVEPPVKPPEADKPLAKNDGGILGIPGYFQKREAKSALEDATAAVAAFKENEKRITPIIWAITDARIAGDEEEEAKALHQWNLREGYTFNNVAHKQKLYDKAKAAIRDVNEKMATLGTAASSELQADVNLLKHQWSMANKYWRAIDIINSIDLYARELHNKLKEIDEKIEELDELDPDSREVLKIKAELKALSAEAGFNAQMVKDLQSARKRLREEIHLEGNKIVSDLTTLVGATDPRVAEANKYTAEAQDALNDALVQDDEISARLNRWNGLRLAYGQDVLPTSAEDLSREGKTLAEHRAEAQGNLFGLLHFTVENIVKDPELFKRYKQAMAVLYPSLKLQQNAAHIQKHMSKALVNAPELKELMELGGQKQLDYWRDGRPLKFRQEKPEEYKAWKEALLKWQIETIANSRSHSEGTMVVVGIRNSSERTVSFYAAELNPTTGEYISKGLLTTYVEAQMTLLRKATDQEERKRILQHMTAGIISASSDPGFATSSAAKRVYQVILSGLDTASIPMSDKEGYDLREATWDMLESDKRLAEEGFSFTAEVPFEAVRRMMIVDIIRTNSTSTLAEKADAKAVKDVYRDMDGDFSLFPDKLAVAERLDARGFKSTDTIATTIPNEAGVGELANYKITEKDGTIHLELQKPDPSDPIAAPMTIATVDIQDLGAERVKVSGSAQPGAGPEVAAMVAQKITAPRASGNKTCVFKLKKYARDWTDIISDETGAKRQAEYVKAILAKGVVPIFEVHKKKDSDSAIWATFRDLAAAANKQYTDLTACAAYLDLVFALGNEKLKEKLITSMFIKTGELVNGQLWIYDGTNVATQAEFEALDPAVQQVFIQKQVIKPQSMLDSDKKHIHEEAAARNPSEAEEKIGLKTRGGKPADPLLAVSTSVEERVKEINKPRSYHVKGARGH